MSYAVPYNFSKGDILLRSGVGKQLIRKTTCCKAKDQKIGGNLDRKRSVQVAFNKC